MFIEGLPNVSNFRNLGGLKLQRRGTMIHALDILDFIIKSKKKVLGVFKGCFLRNLIVEGLFLFISFKGAL